MARRRRAEARDATAYLTFAAELWAACEFCKDSGRGRAAGLNAIHASIAAADAVCVLFKGESSSGEAHGEAAELLAASGAPGAREKAVQLTAILGMKNNIAHERRAPSRVEAEVLVKRAQRFVEWAVETARIKTGRPQ